MGFISFQSDAATPHQTAAAAKEPRGISTILATARQSLVRRLTLTGQWLVTNMVPPLVTIVLLLLVWQILCAKPGSSLPPPTAIWNDSRDLILQPFFDYG
ncbi:MAG TPA: nitrate ABC transporter, permease protein, partial [Beijerinckia sp.]|nr:nitrate ABC transporter, permease protein [Beijerinckia sp.]